MIKQYSKPIVEIPPTVTDGVKENQVHYSAFYVNDNEDSPDRSRIYLLRRIKNCVGDFGKNDWVLDIGAGKQVLEKEYITLRHGSPPPFNLITLDVAELRKYQLLATNYKIPHIKANGTELPFHDESFSLIVSSMALDFMPRDAITEVYRTLKPGRYALVTLHHRSLIPDDLDELIRNEGILGRRRNYFRRDLRVYNFWRYLRDNNILFKDADQIKDVFGEAGFRVERVEEVKFHSDIWWEVGLFKPV